MNDKEYISQLKKQLKEAHATIVELQSKLIAKDLVIEELKNSPAGSEAKPYKKPNTLDDVTIEKIKELRKSGLIMREIAKKLNISEGAVYRYSKDVKQDKTKTMKNGESSYRDVSFVDDIKELRRNGRSFQEISDELNISYYKVSKIAKDIKPEKRRRKNKGVIYYEDIL